MTLDIIYKTLVVSLVLRVVGRQWMRGEDWLLFMCLTETAHLVQVFVDILAQSH